MKKLIIIALIATFYSCSNNDAKVAENTALVEKYIQAVENLDYEAMNDLIADDYMGYGPSFNDSIGKDMAIESFKQNAESLYKSIDYSKSRNIGVVITSGDNQGDWISNWAELKIVYKNSDQAVTIMANTIYQIKDNKIAKSYTFYNEADVLEQLGYVFINPNDL
jgi:hypothetical protein